MDARCGHRGGPLELGDLEDGIAAAGRGPLVRCPWHGRRYCVRTGRELYCAGPTSAVPAPDSAAERRGLCLRAGGLRRRARGSPAGRPAVNEVSAECSDVSTSPAQRLHPTDEREDGLYLCLRPAEGLEARYPSDEFALAEEVPALQGWCPASAVGPGGPWPRPLAAAAPRSMEALLAAEATLEARAVGRATAPKEMTRIPAGGGPGDSSQDAEFLSDEFLF